MKQSEVVILQRKLIARMELELETEKKANRDLRSEVLDVYLKANPVLKAAAELTDHGRRLLGTVPDASVRTLHKASVAYQKKVRGK